MNSFRAGHRVRSADSVALAVYLVSGTMAEGQFNTPQPRDGVTAILEAFDKYAVVALSAGHNNKKLDDFILLLIQAPALPAKVNDIVVECGNSKYQATLDRYIAGDDVPIEEARQVWRNTSVAMCGSA